MVAIEDKRRILVVKFFPRVSLLSDIPDNEALTRRVDISITIAKADITEAFSAIKP